MRLNLKAEKASSKCSISGIAIGKVKLWYSYREEHFVYVRDIVKVFVFLFHLLDIETYIIDVKIDIKEIRIIKTKEFHIIITNYYGETI